MENIFFLPLLPCDRHCYHLEPWPLPGHFLPDNQLFYLSFVTPVSSHNYTNCHFFSSYSIDGSRRLEVISYTILPILLLHSLLASRWHPWCHRKFLPNQQSFHLRSSPPVTLPHIYSSFISYYSNTSHRHQYPKRLPQLLINRRLSEFWLIIKSISRKICRRSSVTSPIILTASPGQEKAASRLFPQNAAPQPIF